MGSLHVSRLAWLRRGSPGRGRRGLAVLAVAVLGAMTLVNGTPHAAYGATKAPYGGTAAAVPGTVYAANSDTGGQGVAYNVPSTNGSANSYRSDGVDLETTADTTNATGAGADDMGWTTAGQWFNYTVNVATAGGYETWPTVDASVTLPTGQQTLRVDQDSNGFNFHFMTFTLTSGGGGGGGGGGSGGDQPFGGTPAAGPGTGPGANND